MRAAKPPGASVRLIRGPARTPRLPCRGRQPARSGVRACRYGPISARGRRTAEADPAPGGPLPFTVLDEGRQDEQQLQRAATRLRLLLASPAT